jgi:glycosyltransferase involved in cell wall biosynthesis
MLLDNEPLRDRLALGAYDRARRDFGTKLFAERLAAVYNSLTGGET